MSGIVKIDGMLINADKIMCVEETEDGVVVTLEGNIECNVDDYTLSTFGDAWRRALQY